MVINIEEKNWAIFGCCRMCGKVLDDEEYCLGSGRCKECAMKCEETVGFGTIYGNVEIKKKEYVFIDNSTW